ncbi:uncharacterized protein LOC129600126 [Paramacrobiotus metropolitanus]|uniref:uncharacterized protein LOC129600126 n=1 Tax=Paramacrobiotus metropolitanus TaxID=2943436 RepID=UPI0024465AE6|nr:uncharacterized protein LOC129600126 [Paramacrobiotus metropolitanus]
MWVYCHMVTLPTFIQDERLRPAKMEHFCFFNTDRRPFWGRALNFLVYQFNEILIIIAYPVTVLLYWRKLRAAKMEDMRRIKKEHYHYQQTAATIRRETRIKYALIVLTTVTCSVVLFWTPLVGYGLLKPLLRLNSAAAFRFQETVLAIYTVQPATDPILLTFALRDVWEQLKKAFPKNNRIDSSQ